MFEVVGQDIISGNMGFIGTDSDRLYRMGAAEKTEDITVTGNPAVLDNATGKPFKDLHIYGRSEQMTTTGAQLLDFSDLIGKTETKNGATYKINEDQSITVSGTPTEYTSFYLKAMSLKAGSYYFLRNSDDKVFVQLISAKADMNNGFTLDEDADGIGVYVVFNVASNNTQSFNSTFTPMLNTGSTALPWEPYTGGKPSPSPDYPQEIQSAGDDGNLSVIVKNPDNEQTQSVSFSTPNGLPGIPVTSSGNYTDEHGQQWVCDEVDLERGVNVQRVKVKELSADDKWTYRKLDSGNNNFQTRIYGEDSAKNSFPAICNILPYKNATWNDDSKNLPKIYANNNEITISFPPSSEYSSLETFKQLLTNAKAFIFYCLATPIETPLTAAEIAAYKSLRSYRGTTIVEAEDKAGISVTYKRNAKAAEKEVNILHADLMAEMEELDENSEIV